MRASTRRALDPPMRVLDTCATSAPASDARPVSNSGETTRTDALQIGLFVVGMTVLVIGYRRNSRNLLLTAALVLLACGAISEFVSGFHAGITGS